MELPNGQTKDISLQLKDRNLPFSYTKVKNLVTALFMVTDIMDKEEILRNNLRKISLEIITDTYSVSYQTDKNIKDIIRKTSLVVSLLDIACDLKMVSVMNNNILKKEFGIFIKSLEEMISNLDFNINENLDLLFKEEESRKSSLFEITEAFPIGHQGQDKENNLSFIKPIQKNIGQEATNLGVQKGSTLLNALREIELSKSKEKVTEVKAKSLAKSLPKNNNKNIVNNSKSSRQEEIVKIIKDAKEGLTITEIKVKSKGEIASMSDKTLQRELVSLVENRVLYKTGEKRWSRYFVS